MGGIEDEAGAKLLRASEPSSSDVLPSRAVALKKQAAALTRALWDSGVACVCSAAVVFSLSAFFVKLMGEDMPVFEIVAVRSVSSFLVCAAYARAAGIAPLFGKRSNLKFLLSRGLFGAAAMTSYYFSLKLLPLADAVTLFFLNPAVTAVVAWAVLKEPLGGRGVAGVLVSVAGLVLITRPPFLGFSSGSSSGGSDDGSGSSSSSSAALHGDGGVGVSSAAAAAAGGGGGGTAWDAQRLLGTLFGVLSAVLSAGAFVSIRFIGKSEPALVMSVYFHLSAAASCALPLALGLPERAVAPSGLQWLLLAGVAATSFWGQILIGRGFQLLSAARASAINFTQVVYSYILGLLFLNESLSLSGGAGSALIATGAVLVNLRPKPPPAAAPAAAAGAAAAEAAEGGGAAGLQRSRSKGLDTSDGEEEAMAAQAAVVAAAAATVGRGTTAGADGPDEEKGACRGAGPEGRAHADTRGGTREVELHAVLVDGSSSSSSGSGRSGSSCGSDSGGSRAAEKAEAAPAVAEPAAQLLQLLPLPSSTPGPAMVVASGTGAWGNTSQAHPVGCQESDAGAWRHHRAESEGSPYAEAEAESETATLLRCTVSWRAEASSSSSNSGSGSSSSAAAAARAAPAATPGSAAAALPLPFGDEAASAKEPLPPHTDVCSGQKHDWGAAGWGAARAEQEEERQGLLPGAAETG